jgi:hypothetical protein
MTLHRPSPLCAANTGREQVQQNTVVRGREAGTHSLPPFKKNLLAVAGIIANRFFFALQRVASSSWFAPAKTASGGWGALRTP